MMGTNIALEDMQLQMGELQRTNLALQSEVAEARAERDNAQRAFIMMKASAEGFREEVAQLKKVAFQAQEAAKEQLAKADEWKWEYENLCKFATDYEQQRDRLQETLELLNEHLPGCKCFTDPQCMYADAILKHALERSPTPSQLEEKL